MKKTFLLLAIIVVATFFFVLIPVSAAYADTGDAAPAETWSDAALRWWNQNQSSVASYAAMLMSAVASAIIVRVKSKTATVTASVDDSNRYSRRLAERVDANTEKLEAVLAEVTALRADLAVTKAQAAKTEKLMQGSLKLLMQVYIPSGIPEYVKAEIMETYKATVGAARLDDKDISDAGEILASLEAAKTAYEEQKTAATYVR